MHFLHSATTGAALTLSISVSGSEQAFVRQMNLRAQALGLRQTHFANPHGLDSGERITRPRATFAALTQAALQNQQFRTVVGTKTITCAGRTLTNHNKLLWRYDGCIGVKTGYTRHAGRILVSAAERGESQLIAVTLADPDDWRDHAALLDYGFAVLAAQTPVYPQNRRIVWKNDCKKILARCAGVSRRKAEELIADGRVRASTAIPPASASRRTGMRTSSSSTASVCGRGRSRKRSTACSASRAAS